MGRPGKLAKGLIVFLYSHNLTDVPAETLDTLPWLFSFGKCDNTEEKWCLKPDPSGRAA
jgi:hypothetical protein